MGEHVRGQRKLSEQLLQLVIIQAVPLAAVYLRESIVVIQQVCLEYLEVVSENGRFYFLEFEVGFFRFTRALFELLVFRFYGISFVDEHLRHLMPLYLLNCQVNLFLCHSLIVYHFVVVHSCDDLVQQLLADVFVACEDSVFLFELVYLASDEELEGHG